MFKKPIKIQSKTPLSQKDKKKIRDIISQRFPILSQNENLLNLLLPKKTSKNASNEIFLSKITGTKILIYSQDNQPLFFDIDGRNRDIWPTIYALWKVPFLLQPIPVQKPVLEYLKKGADLMLPGCVLSEEHLNFMKGDARCVTLSNTNLGPVAVGTMEINYLTVSQTSKGKAMNILHVFGDSLWELGGKGEIPNINWENKVVLKESQKEEEKEKCVKEKSVLYENDKIFLIFPQKNNENQNQNEPSKKSDQSQKDNNLNNLNNNNNNSNSQEECDDEKEEKNEEEEEKMNDEELVEYCFLSALRKLSPSDFPILLNVFWNNLVNERPSDTTVNIKATRWKKLSTLTKEYEKDGLLKLGEISNGVLQILSKERSHPKLVKFRQDYPIEVEDVVNQKKLTITSLLKPPKNLHFLLGSELQSSTCIRERIFKYMEENRLTNEQNKNEVVLDELLAQSRVFPNSKIGSTVEKKNFNQKILSKLSNWYQVNNTISQKNILKNGQIPHLKFIVKRRGGHKKKVTHVLGLEDFCINPTDLISELSKIGALSVSVSDLPQKGKQELVLQGDACDLVKKYLGEKYDFNLNLIDVEKPKPVVPKKTKNKKR